MLFGCVRYVGRIGRNEKENLHIGGEMDYKKIKIIGDKSLSNRDFSRITDPLQIFGANIKTNKFCQIRRGVYSVILKIPKKFGEKKLFGIANFGIKPTFNKTNPLLEVHIFNFENDIYHERIKVTFNKFIREEKKFESVEKLKDQIIKDINQVKNDKLFKNNQSS